MTKTEILQILLTIAREILDDDDVEFSLDTPFSDVPDWDSLSNMHIIVRVEKKLGIDFKQSDFPPMVRIGELVDVIALKIPS